MTAMYWMNCVSQHSCENTRRWPFISQEDSPHQELNQGHSDVQLLSLQNCEKCLFFKKHKVLRVLLQLGPHRQSYINTDTLTHMYKHIYISIYICTYIKHVFTLILDYNSTPQVLFLCLLVSSFSPSEKPGSHYRQFMYLFRIANLEKLRFI